MARLLVVHHSPTDRLAGLTGAVLEGAGNPAIVGVEVVSRPALEATADDVLGADGYVLGTPANLGYMSGALKHFFDTTYNDCLEVSTGRPWGMWVHGATDTTGARLAVEKVVTGLGWRAAAEPVELVGDEPDGIDRCWELGAVMAAHLMA